MPSASKGLYSPLLADITFGAMGIGSAIVLAFKTDPVRETFASTAGAGLPGPILLGLVLLFAIAACLFHRFDRRQWDDYMVEVVTQSALIGMIAFLLAGAVGEFFAIELLGDPTQLPFALGALPMAVLAWSVGYAFLRLRGTGK